MSCVGKILEVFDCVCSGSKLSLQSEQTSTADSGHDITTPGSLSPEMPLYHVEQVVKVSVWAKDYCCRYSWSHNTLSLFRK